MKLTSLRIVLCTTAALAWTGVALAQQITVRPEASGAITVNSAISSGASSFSPQVGSFSVTGSISTTSSNSVPRGVIFAAPPPPPPPPVIVPALVIVSTSAALPGAPSINAKNFNVLTMITANLHQIQWRSGSTHAIDLYGDGLITFTGDGKKLGIANAAALEAGAGPVVMNSATVSNYMNSVINLDGVVDADAFRSSNSGGMVLVASPANPDNNRSK